ncbi:hypothetical protein NDU88_005871 [Pleurodeles waltl]|uniref:Uncharacterized protein n=1 Tax=Pleurodeles waltl TaxID=8319 RepID=A0AAV7MBU9_PLEWA|nr:hypothetical protein NDU88_005871 [Pleurodeles waltl]
MTGIGSRTPELWHLRPHWTAILQGGDARGLLTEPRDHSASSGRAANRGEGPGGCNGRHEVRPTVVKMAAA